MTERQSTDWELLLKHPRRRYALYCLYTYATPMSLPHLADLVTELEYVGRVEDHKEERLGIYMELIHDHVPDLEEAGIVSYSEAEELVDRGPKWAAIQPHLKRYAVFSTAGSPERVESQLGTRNTLS